MRAGNLDRRITVQTKTLTANSYGERVASWADTFTTWANVFEIAGKEKFEASQLVDKADIRFSIRYRTGVNEEQRIVYDSNYYDIYSVTELGRQDGLEIFATKIPLT